MKQLFLPLIFLFLLSCTVPNQKTAATDQDVTSNLHSVDFEGCKVLIYDSPNGVAMMPAPKCINRAVLNLSAE